MYNFSRLNNCKFYGSGLCGCVGWDCEPTEAMNIEVGTMHYVSWCKICGAICLGSKKCVFISCIFVIVTNIFLPRSLATIKLILQRCGDCGEWRNKIFLLNYVDSVGEICVKFSFFGLERVIHQYIVLLCVCLQGPGCTGKISV